MNSKAIELFDGGFDTTFVFFGGLAGEIGIPQMEFVSVTKDLKINRIFVRDCQQAWYSYGLNNSARTFSGSCFEVANFVNKISSKKRVFVGNSSGAFAAILFGETLIAEKIIAFSPQSFIDKQNRDDFSDWRWNSHMRKIHQGSLVNVQFFDLGQTHFESNIDIHYSTEDHLDALQAERFHGGLINFYDYPFGNHDNLVKILREQRRLKEIFEREI